MHVNFRSNTQFSVSNPPVSTNGAVSPANKSDFERTPSIDTVNIKKKNKKKRTLIAIGIAAILGTSAVMGLREAHIKKAQKTFQEVFMRDDISRKETVDILKRYKKIEKIKDKDEYVKAMFNEAKKNYKLENIKELELRYGKNFDKFMTENNLGNAAMNPEVTIRTTIERKDVKSTVHHELRHIKQHYYAFNYDTEDWLKYHNSTLEGVFKKYPIDKSTLENFWGVTFDKKNVPEKYHEFAQKVLNNLKDYKDGNIDYKAYREQFVEADAFNAGSKMEAIIKSFWNKLI